MDERLLILEPYIKECLSKIDNATFNEADFRDAVILKKRFVEKHMIDNNMSLDDVLKFNRKYLIDIKLSHTARVMDIGNKLAKRLKTGKDYQRLLDWATLLHDIGRFDQATWNNNLTDTCYKKVEGISNHAEAGYDLLVNKNIFNMFELTDLEKELIGKAVKYHSLSKLEGDLALKFKDPKQLENMNNKKIIQAALIQMVKDADMIDILYQQATGHLEFIDFDVNYLVNNDSLQTIANNWGITKEEILKYNEIDLKTFKKLKRIRIPLINVDSKKLKVTDEFKSRFYSGNDFKLLDLIESREWNFVTRIWWRLGQFLNNLSFDESKEIIDEMQILPNMYNKVPDNYRPLVEEAFDYSYNVLLRAKKNNYLKRKKN